jgi:hypothetical protein
VSDKSKPQIVVYALADALAALQAAAERNIDITLVSPAGATAYGGPAWFRELVSQAREAVPSATFDSVLDCGTEAGHALAAIRTGVEAICFSGPDDVRSKIQDIATQSGCAVAEIDYARALDLNECADPVATCRAWLTAQEVENTV